MILYIMKEIPGEQIPCAWKQGQMEITAYRISIRPDRKGRRLGTDPMGD
ncbi:MULTISPECIES: hypothetical protein [Clostridia]|nr:MULTISPECIES: hypothetical protein [Clostridia]MCH1936927.1 hypothetical protein [Enterocloster sp. OA11]